MADPSFFQKYDGVILDWRYLDTRSEEEIKRESGWLKRHRVKIAVDFSSGINLYPDLRLINNDREEYERSIAVIEDVIRKTVLIGGDKILLSTHRVPENNYTYEKTWSDTVETLKSIASYAEERGIFVLLRVDLEHSPATLDEGNRVLEGVNAENFKLAPRLQFLLSDPEKAESLSEKIGLVFESGFLEDEINGTFWSSDTPAENSFDPETVKRFFDEHPEFSRSAERF